MNEKIIIIVSIIITITIGIGAFSFTQSEMIKKQPASQSVENKEIANLLQKIEEDRIGAELSGEFDMNKPREWITSGPFQIDRSIYHLGEKIFVNVESLPSDVKVQMIFSKIINSTHAHPFKKLSFDGSKPQQQNMYFPVYPSQSRQFCTVDDIVGDWEVTFQGANLKPLEFKIINKFVPGNETYFDPVC